MARPEEVVQAARSNGIEATLFSGLDPVRTVIEASQTLDRDLSEVVNTVLVTVGEDPVLVLVPGDRRVDGRLVGELYGAEPLKVSLATRRETEEQTGYSTSLIPPFGLEESIEVLVDENLLEHETIVMPTGSPRAMLEVRSEDLTNLPNSTLGTWSIPAEE